MAPNLQYKVHVIYIGYKVNLVALQITCGPVYSHNLLLDSI